MTFAKALAASIRGNTVWQIRLQLPGGTLEPGYSPDFWFRVYIQGLAKDFEKEELVLKLRTFLLDSWVHCYMQIQIRGYPGPEKIGLLPALV